VSNVLSSFNQVISGRKTLKEVFDSKKESIQTEIDKYLNGVIE
jgi:hypothetical protein